MGEPQIDRPEVTACHVHPRDIGAAIVSFDEMRPAESWLWGGPDWRSNRARHVSRISAVEIQGTDPEALAARWSTVFDRPLHREGGALVMPLDEGEVRFLVAEDGRGDGVAGVQFDVIDRQAIDEAADRLGLNWHDDDELTVCGTRCLFRSIR